jgi:diadenosine tetraphosphate (Ap4A) HIT family hydrolase
VAECLFCDRTRHRIIGESFSWYVRHDNFPASPGHVELVTKRHVESLFDLDSAESGEMHGVLLYARRLVAEELGAEPDGWTIGVNDGAAAGRSIDHLHIHLIPRYHGDVPDPRGGIRQCAPGWAPDSWVIPGRDL